MIDALCDGLLPLLQGNDLQVSKTALEECLSDALTNYQSWQPPPTAGAGAALFAKMACTYAIYCLDIEGNLAAVL